MAMQQNWGHQPIMSPTLLTHQPVYIRPQQQTGEMYIQQVQPIQSQQIQLQTKQPTGQKSLANILPANHNVAQAQPPCCSPLPPVAANGKPKRPKNAKSGGGGGTGSRATKNAANANRGPGRPVKAPAQLTASSKADAKDAETTTEAPAVSKRQVKKQEKEKEKEKEQEKEQEKTPPPQPVEEVPETLPPEDQPAVAEAAAVATELKSEATSETASASVVMTTAPAFNGTDTLPNSIAPLQGAASVELAPPSEVRENQPATAVVKPHILTHVIEGYVIQEGPEPFPVNRSSLLIEYDQPPKPQTPSLKPTEIEAGPPPAKKQKVDARSKMTDGELLSCEFCHNTDFKHKFKRSKRFCSNTCAKRYNVGCSRRIGRFKPKSEGLELPVYNKKRKDRTAGWTEGSDSQLGSRATDMDDKVNRSSLLIEYDQPPKPQTPSLKPTEIEAGPPPAKKQKGILLTVAHRSYHKQKQKLADVEKVMNRSQIEDDIFGVNHHEDSPAKSGSEDADPDYLPTSPQVLWSDALYKENLEMVIEEEKCICFKGPGSLRAS
ncbi:PREDICTED: polyhomeotic-like protein 2 [Priapulus caudatus]|uniref:Polyhomeotic-like protein 2 n=1 Tax=Priapulus caudatus TaxID=37621 RepID=A0ABM1DW39_PRICU|nr:PREDICTED: polyhomeotic-like protein 2 [Priapulus caudatus]